MNSQFSINRPHTTVILAMSADGKIADRNRSPARFGSITDKTHLETQIANADGVLFGRGTLEAYGTTLSISSTELLNQRQQQGKSPQPIQIVCSSSGKINRNFRFFKQPIPRWLITTKDNINSDSETRDLNFYPDFERVLRTPTLEENQKMIDWNDGFQQLLKLGLKKLAILGGGQLVGSLIERNLVDELWLTICPLIIGGINAPTPVEGKGFLSSVAPRLKLLDVKPIEQEVFLHYQVLRNP